MEYLPNLENLDLSNNRIIKIDTRMFPVTSNLRTLNLSGNQIREIELNSFKSLCKLKILNWESNKFSQIHANLFVTLQLVKKVSVGKNSIYHQDLISYSIFSPKYIFTSDWSKFLREFLSQWDRFASFSISLISFFVCLIKQILFKKSFVLKEHF